MKNYLTACASYSFSVCKIADFVDLSSYSLQFDPAPRAGEPLVSRRVPDYFLVRVTSRSIVALTLMTHTCISSDIVVFPGYLSDLCGVCVLGMHVHVQRPDPCSHISCHIV